MRAHPRKQAVVTTTAARRTFAAAVLPTNAMRVQENARLAHGPSRGSFCFLVIQVPKYTMGALSIIGAKNGAQQASAVLSWGSVLWCGAMAIAHHTHHGQVRACVMAHTTHTPSYTPHWGWGRGSVVWRARATRATPPREPGVGGRIEWHWQRGRQSGGFARHRRLVHGVVVLACHAADVVDLAGVPRTEGGGIGGELRRRRRCAAARGTAAARAATRRAAGRNRCLYLILWILYLSRGIT